MDTTYVDRSNTNALVFECGCANQKMEEDGKTKTVVNFQQVKIKIETKRTCQIITNNQSNLYKSIFAGGTLEK